MKKTYKADALKPYRIWGEITLPLSTQLSNAAVIWELNEAITKAGNERTTMNCSNSELMLTKDGEKNVMWRFTVWKIKKENNVGCNDEGEEGRITK